MALPGVGFNEQMRDWTVWCLASDSAPETKTTNQTMSGRASVSQPIMSTIKDKDRGSGRGRARVVTV